MGRDISVGKVTTLRREQVLGKKLSCEPLAMNTPEMGAMRTSVLKGDLDYTGGWGSYFASMP